MRGSPLGHMRERRLPSFNLAAQQSRWPADPPLAVGAAPMARLGHVRERGSRSVLGRRWRRVPQFNEEMKVEVSEQRIASASARSSAMGTHAAHARLATAKRRCERLMRGIGGERTHDHSLAPPLG
jgi:hypothetical protein